VPDSSHSVRAPDYTKKATIEDFRAQPSRAARKEFNRRFSKLADLVEKRRRCRFKHYNTAHWATFTDRDSNGPHEVVKRLGQVSKKTRFSSLISQAYDPQIVLG
jgi:hypothetical protein